MSTGVHSILGTSDTLEDHVQQGRKILRGLARPHRKAQAEIIHNGKGRARVRGQPAQSSPPKRDSGQGTITPILLALTKGKSNSSHATQAAKILIAIAGSITPQKLRPAHAIEANEIICGSGWTHSTQAGKAAAMKRLLRWLSKHHGSQELADLIAAHPGLRPRNVVASEAEISALLAASRPHMRLWLLLCSDLAIRSGTAARLAPAHYDQRSAILRFATKLGEKLTLPVTAEIAAILNTCDPANPESFVRQLWQRHRLRHAPQSKPFKNSNQLNSQFQKLRRSIGITRKLTPHDLRRTTAVAMLEATGDIRDAQALLGHRSLQSTVWYLDHDLRKVSRQTLELIKRRTA